MPGVEAISELLGQCRGPQRQPEHAAANDGCGDSKQPVLAAGKGAIFGDHVLQDANDGAVAQPLDAAPQIGQHEIKCKAAQKRLHGEPTQDRAGAAPARKDVHRRHRGPNAGDEQPAP